MESTIWKDVVGYGSNYIISNNSIVKSVKFNKERILKPHLGIRGYYEVKLCLNGKQKTRSVHQLMAEAFLGHTPCGFKLVVDHIDTNKLNNNISNLRIVTNRENCNLKHIKSSSIYTGVGFNKTRNKWIATIVINGKLKHLGAFNIQEEASQCYENALFCHNNNLPIKTNVKDKSSNFKGVCWDNKRNKWKSQITINGKSKSLGRFNTEIEAYKYLQEFQKGASQFNLK